MSEFKVFYSWQSDLPNATNRTFIGEALKKACEEVASNPEIEESPRVDQDTQGLAGSPSIPQAIMEKIDSCQAFVADVSYCYRADDGTVAPNPNVAYELGYAVARLGWERIILVVNTEFGPVESLPFDMEKRRATRYEAKVGEKDRSQAKKTLTQALAIGIETIARRQPIVTRVTPAEAARDSIIHQSPDRIIRIREFWRWLMSSIKELDPGPGVSVAGWVEALPSTLPVIEAFSSVVEVAAIADSTSAMHEIWRGLETVLQEYDLPVRFSGQYNPWQFDWWKFHGHEMCVLIIAHLLRERKLELIGDLLQQGFVQRRWAETRNSGWADFRDLSAHLEYADAWNSELKKAGNNGWICPHGELLKRRYEQGPDLLPDWQSFIEADLLLAFVSQSSHIPFSYSWWINWSHIYLRSTPRFFQDAGSPTYANEMMGLFRASDIPQLRELLLEWWQKLDSRWGPDYFGGLHRVSADVINSVGGRDSD